MNRMKTIFSLSLGLLLGACSFFGGLGEELPPGPVLLVLADHHFYYQEYADPRRALEERGLQVRVANGAGGPSVPHPDTGQPAGDPGTLDADLRLADVVPAQFSALVLVGGWGASRYYYAFPGDADDPAYDRVSEHAAALNNLINAFLDLGRPVMGVCNGVNVLAWARREGNSPLQGLTVSAPYLASMPMTYEGTHYGGGDPAFAFHGFVTDNGGTVRPQNSVGDPDSNADDVSETGLILTVQDNFAAYAGGIRLAERILP